ncbi:tRNA (guanine(9)-N(1))-methyltransferase [Clarireedia jacksonii]
MSDIDERPSKIRKLESTEDAPASISLSAPESSEQPTTAKLEAPKLAQDAPTNTEAAAPSSDQPPLSKKQLKKLKKTQAWEAQKAQRTEFRRTKRREKAARKAIAKAEGRLPAPPPPSSRRPRPVPVSFLIDCDFDSYMTEKELISLTAQVTRCYSDNRTAVYRGHMGISSWGGKMRERFETVLGGHYKGWKGVKFLEENWVDARKVMDEVMRGRDGGKVVGALATANGLPEAEGKNAQAAKVDENSGEKVTEKPELSQTESVAEFSAPAQSESLADPSQAHTIPESTQSTLPHPSGVQPPSTSSVPSAGSEGPAPSPQPNLIYLSSDSENTLTTLSPYTTYVIGGIVDKNRYKGLCYKRACEAGIPTAKLPIGEYMEMQSRSVLTVNHVMEIMIRWLETGDWGEAFLKVIPKRKEAKLRGKVRGRDEKEHEGEDANDGEGERDGSENESDDEAEKATGIDTVTSEEQPEAVET